MAIVDVFTHYLFALHYISLVLMCLMVVFAIDDIFIDIYYWARRFWRLLFIYRKRNTFDEQALVNVKEKPLAIMVPAWQEVGVVANMAALTASELDYENYQIFVGTYPNDEATQKDVDEVCQKFPNIHKVVCARPGPTSKADCLNNVIAAILAFEKKTNVKFAGFIMHDAEDVVSAMELRLFNYLLEKKDLIQLPVYPFTTSPWAFTAGHYLDEFSEMHGKDMVVREAMVGQVPSAGVGTCFSRRAILKLSEEGDGLPFDIQSLTEDYDIGFRMKQWGMEEIFVHFAVSDLKYAKFAEKSKSRSYQGGNVVCVREYFPDTLATSVRQKSRWIIGIVFQGIQVHRWSSNWKLNYFLWRDRKGVIAHFLSFFATIILLNVLLLDLYNYLFAGGYRFLSVFKNDPLSLFLIQVNLLFFINRIVQRMIFVRRYYGVVQALVSPLRLFWGNLINFLANLRAIRQVIEQGWNPRRVAWDKTEHIYPTMSDRNTGRSLGTILMDKGLLSESEILVALEQRSPDEKLGQVLLRLKLVTVTELGTALAEQANTEFTEIDPFSLSNATIKALDTDIALKYQVLPIEADNEHIKLISENSLSPVSIASIGRKTGKKITYDLCQAGAVTLGLRYHYQGDLSCDPTPKLETMRAQNLLSTEDCRQIKQRFMSLQIPFGDALKQAGMIELPVFNQLMLGFDFNSGQKLGDYFISENILTDEVVQNVLALQRKHQSTLDAIINELVGENMEIVV